MSMYGTLPKGYKPGGRLQTEVFGESKTRTDYKNECDINRIMKTYRVTGVLPQQRTGFFADVSSVRDYADSLQLIKDAQYEFDMLPSQIRKRFANNPEELLRFIHDPRNRAEAIELGLIVKPEPKKEPESEKKGKKKLDTEAEE